MNVDALPLRLIEDGQLSNLQIGVDSMKENLTMIQTKDRLIEAAGMLLDPHVIVDTRAGSKSARWYLIDGAVLMPLDDYPELPRALFNGLRDQGILYEPKDGPLRIADFRSFQVKVGGKVDAEGQERTL